MKKSHLSTKILAAATTAISSISITSAANAASLVPTIEGEIKTDMGCKSSANCIDTTDSSQMPFTYSVTSLEYDTDDVGPKFSKSLLFTDKRQTENNYDLPGALRIRFGKTDSGTNTPAEQIWLRPAAMLENGTPFENGKLEVGRFLFDFLGKTASVLDLDFFDVEDKNFTGILKVNGVALTPAMYATVGPSPNGKIQRLTLTDVQTLEIQIGKPGPNSVFSKTGDGVMLRASVPEPGNVASLTIIVVFGFFGVRQVKKVSEVA
jgi:hypothetical protein